MPPEIQYARAGDIFIAYQVVGDGPVDIVFLPFLFSNLESMWQQEPMVRFFEQASSFARLILFDQRGTGLSDPVAISDLITLEERARDISAVMDAAGSKQAALFGTSLAGPIAAYFAAAHADRTSALILGNTGARFTRTEDYPIGAPPENYERLAESALEAWGSTDFVALRRLDPVLRSRVASYHRMSMGRGAAAAMFRASGVLDVRDVLSAIHVPTLVLHRRENRLIGVAIGRYLAEHIGGARFVEIPGPDPRWVSLEELDEVQEFLTGVRAAPEPKRVLATVLFTDLVASTERAAELGDRRWRNVLEQHDRLLRREFDRFGGSVVSKAGDGFLARFDGPARAIRCASAIRDAVREINVQVRAGVHTGEVEILGEDIGGIAVHIGARVSAMAGPGEVLVSSTVVDLVAGSGIEFEDRGEHELKGVPRPWRIYAVRG